MPLDDDVELGKGGGGGGGVATAVVAPVGAASVPQARVVGGPQATMDDEALARAMQEDEMRRAGMPPTALAVLATTANPPAGANANANATTGGGLTVDKLERSIRMGFLRKVFAYVVMEILVMVGVVSLFMFVPSIKAVCSRTNPDGSHNSSSTAMLFGTGLLLIFSIVCTSCCTPLYRVFPHNIIQDCLLSASVSTFFGVLAVWVNDPRLVYACFGIAAAVILALAVFACQTSHDFTGLGPYLLMSVVILIFACLLGFTWAGFAIFYVALCVLVFSAYVIYDVQLIVGGKHRRFSFGVDDSVVASIAIFTDFILIFGLLLGGASCMSGQ